MGSLLPLAVAAVFVYLLIGLRFFMMFRRDTIADAAASARIHGAGGGSAEPEADLDQPVSCWIILVWGPLSILCFCVILVRWLNWLDEPNPSELFREFRDMRERRCQANR